MAVSLFTTPLLQDSMPRATSAEQVACIADTFAQPRCGRMSTPRRDTVFITTDSEHDGFMSMCIGRVYLFFSFVYEGLYYPCALVHWFVPVGETVHSETGQWVVKPEYIGNGPNRQQNLAVIHIDSIARDALLSPVYGEGYLPDNFHFSHALDAFHTYFVNSYADHQMHEFIPKTR